MLVQAEEGSLSKLNKCYCQRKTCNWLFCFLHSQNLINGEQPLFIIALSRPVATSILQILPHIHLCNTPTSVSGKQTVLASVWAQAHLDTWRGRGRGLNQQPFGCQTTRSTCCARPPSPSSLCCWQPFWLPLEKLILSRVKRESGRG